MTDGLDVFTLRLTTLQLVTCLLRHPGRLTFRAVETTASARLALYWLQKLRPSRVAGIVPYQPVVGGASIDGVMTFSRVQSTSQQLAYHIAPPQIAEGLPKSEIPVQEDWGCLLRSAFVHRNFQAFCFIAAIENDLHHEIRRAVIYFPSDGTGELIRDAYPVAIHGLELRPWLSLRSLVDLIRIVPGNLRQWSAVLRHRDHLTKSDVHQDAISSGIMMLQGFWGSLRSFPDLGHMAWLANSRTDRRRIAVYFDRSDTTLSPESAAAASALGCGWANADFPPAYIPNLGRRLAVHLGWMIRHCPLGKETMAWWRWSLLGRMSFLHAGHREFVHRFNVKALHQIEEFVPESLSMIMAVRRNNGLVIWFLWSVLLYLVARYRTALADVVFGWGDLHEGYYYLHDMGHPAVIKTGTISSGGQVSSKSHDRATALRQKLAPNLKVFAVFDTGTDWTTPLGPSDIKAFYGAVLDACRARPDLGLIIKPKGSSLTVLPDNIRQELTDMERNGRCLILEGAEQPLIAGLAADCVICTPIATAGLVAALAGKPVLHYDTTGNRFYPFAEPGFLDDAVFTTGPKLTAAILDFCNGNPNVGNNISILSRLDSFQDGLGHLRAAEFIDSLMAGFAQNLDADQVMAAAIAQYRSHWGKDKASVDPSEADPWGLEAWRKFARLSHGDEWPEILKRSP